MARVMSSWLERARQIAALEPTKEPPAGTASSAALMADKINEIDKTPAEGAEKVSVRGTRPF